jgi:hypothetical protein
MQNVTQDHASQPVEVERLVDSDDPGARHVAGALRIGEVEYSGRARRARAHARSRR